MAQMSDALRRMEEQERREYAARHAAKKAALKATANGIAKEARVVRIATRKGNGKQGRIGNSPEPKPAFTEHIPTFRLMRFVDFGAGIKSRYVVKGLIPDGGLVVVWGPPKCGKSFWAMDLALHIARGADYRGHRVKQGIVVYLALEGETGFKTRRDAYAKRFLEPDEDPPFYLVTAQIDLRKQAKTLVKDIGGQLGPAEKPSLIVIDTLNRSLVGSESKDEDMADYIRKADAIRAAFDCAVLIVHHCGIAGDRPRGHTSLTGAADAQLSVRRDESGSVLVTVEHMKDGDIGEVIASRLEVVELEPDEDGDPVASCVIMPEEGPAEKPKKPPKLPKGARLALAALYELVAASGEVPPFDSHIGDNVKVVARCLGEIHLPARRHQVRLWRQPP